MPKKINITDKTKVSIYMNKEDKDQVKAIFNAMGIDLTTATNIFYKQVLKCNGFPFKPSLNSSDDTEGCDKNVI